MNVVILVLNDMASDARTWREAAALAEAGHSVTVVALAGEGLLMREDADGFTITRSLSSTTATARQPLRKLRQSREREESAVQAALAARPDIVHAHDTDTLSAGARIKRLTGATLVYGADELYPEMLIANRANVPAPILAYWRSVERRLVPQADAVVTVGDAVAEELRRRFGIEPVVVRSVPQLRPLGDRSRLRQRLGVSEGAVVLLYQGLVNHGRGLSQMIEAVSHVPEVHFAVQGMGPTVDAFLDRVAASPARGRIHYLGKAPQEELHDWASGADIGDLVIENTSLNNYLAAPNKLFGYMMAGVPTLASDFPEMASILGEGPAGITVDPASTGSIVEGLRSLAVDRDLRERMGANARRLAETRYNWDIEKQKLLELYARLSAARSTS